MEIVWGGGCSVCQKLLVRFGWHEGRQIVIVDCPKCGYETPFELLGKKGACRCNTPLVHHCSRDGVEKIAVICWDCELAMLFGSQQISEILTLHRDLTVSGILLSPGPVRVH